MTAPVITAPAEDPAALPELSFSEQVVGVHADIFGMQNGVPSVENYNEAWQLAQDIEYDQRRGVWIGPDGEELNGEIAEDLQYIAKPDTWVLSNGQQHVLDHTWRTLTGNRPEASDDTYTTAMADAIASRVLVDPNAVQNEDLERLLELNETVRAQMAERQVPQEEIREMELRNEAEMTLAVPHIGQTGEIIVPGAKEGYAALMKNQPEGVGANEGRIAVKRDAEARGISTEGEDGDILARLVADGRIHSVETVASALYPEKIANGSHTYNKFWARNSRQGGMGNLTDDERAEVDMFMHQLSTVQGLDRTVIRDFQNHVEHLPSSAEIAGALFPNNPSRELTLGQQAAVDAVRARLIEVRMNQVLPERMVWLRDRVWALQKSAAWSATKGAAAGFAKQAKGLHETMKGFKGIPVARLVGAAAMSLALVTTVMGGPLQRDVSAATRAEDSHSIFQESPAWSLTAHSAAGLDPNVRVALSGATYANREARFARPQHAAIGAVAGQRLVAAAGLAQERVLAFGVRVELLKNEALQSLTGYVGGRMREMGLIDPEQGMSQRNTRIAAALTFVAAGAISYMRLRAGLASGHTGTSQQAADLVSQQYSTGGTGTTAAASLPTDDLMPPKGPRNIPQVTVPVDNGSTTSLGEWNGGVSNKYGQHPGSVNYVLADHLQSVDLDSQYSGLSSHQRGLLSQKLMDYNNFTMPSNKMPSNLQIKMPPRALLMDWLSEIKDED